MASFWSPDFVLWQFCWKLTFTSGFQQNWQTANHGFALWPWRLLNSHHKKVIKLHQSCDWLALLPSHLTTVMTVMGSLHYSHISRTTCNCQFLSLSISASMHSQKAARNGPSFWDGIWSKVPQNELHFWVWFLNQIISKQKNIKEKHCWWKLLLHLGILCSIIMSWILRKESWEIDLWHFFYVLVPTFGGPWP